MMKLQCFRSQRVLFGFWTYMYSASLCVSSTDMPSSTHSPRPIELICSSPTAKKTQQNEHWHRDIRQCRAHKEHDQLEEIRQRRFYAFTSSKFVHFQVSMKALQAALDMCGYLQLQWICFSSWILETDLNLAVNVLYLTVWGSHWPSVHWSSEIISTHVSKSNQCNLSHRWMP